jgi:hypothetical protein
MRLDLSARLPRSSAQWLATVVSAFVLAVGAHAGVGDALVAIDGTFGPFLQSTKIVDTTPGASATFTSQTVCCGPGADYRLTSHTFNDGTIIVAHFDANGLFITPSARPIAELDFAASLVHFTGASVGGAVSYRLGLLQNGSYYGGPTIDVFSTLWASYLQTSLKASDFTLFAGSGPARPDFSCSGAQIHFGFLTGNSAGPSGPFTKDSGIDDWTVTVRFADTTLRDDTMAATDWTSTKIVDTTPGAAATTVSVSQPSGGAPGPYRETSHTWSDGAIFVAHLNSNFVHDPSVQPIHSIDFRAAANHFTFPTVGGAVALAVLVQQGSGYYAPPVINVFGNAWTSYVQTGFTSADFALVAGSGPPHPDFSSGGALLTFGYMTANSASGGPVTKTIGVDGYEVRRWLTPWCSSSTGTAGCFGDDPSDPCPCFPAVPLGVPGRGCPNSLEPRGALLVALGNPSVSNDTVVLQGLGMPNASCLYFQGAATVSAGFGDGRRCATGTTVRLGTKINVCNSSQYPAGPEMVVSVKGGVVPGNVRHYQVWYRNAAAFCTAAAFNLTNMVTIQWNP